MTVIRIKRRIARLQLQLEQYDKNNMKSMTAHGGWGIGYIEGKLSILEELLDEL